MGTLVPSRALVANRVTRGCSCPQGCLDQRIRAWQRWQEAQSTLQKKREAEAKLLWANKPDKLQQAKEEISEVAKSKLLFCLILWICSEMSVFGKSPCFSSSVGVQGHSVWEGFRQGWNDCQEGVSPVWGEERSWCFSFLAACNKVTFKPPKWWTVLMSVLQGG